MSSLYNDTVMASVFLKEYRRQFSERYKELKSIGFCEESAINILADEIEAILTEEDKKNFREIDYKLLAQEMSGNYFFSS